MPPAPPALPERSLRLSFGLTVVTSGVLLLGLLGVGLDHGVHDPLFTLLFKIHLGIIAVAALLGVRFFFSSAAAFPLGAPSAWLILLLVTAAVTTNALLPVTARDALIHHLAVPKWWLDGGQIAPVVWHEWSYYPMLLNLAFTGFLQLNLESGATLYHALYLLLLSTIVGTFLTVRTESRTYGCIGFLVTATLPLCFKLATIPLVDLGLATFAALSLAHVIYWAEEGENPIDLVIAGLALGLALGTKYNSLLFAVMLAPALFIYLRREGLPWGRIFFLGAFVYTCAAVAYAPWLLKNLTWIGNPFYPQLSNYFGPFDPNPVELPGLSGFGQRILRYGDDWIDILLTPVQMILFGQDDDPRHFDGVLSPLLLLGFIPLWRLRREPWAILFVILTLAYTYAALFSAAPRTRYYIPLVLPVLTLAVLGVRYLATLRPRHERLIAGAIITLHCGWGIWYAITVTGQNDPLPYLEGSQNRAEFLRDRLTEYPMIEFINAHATEGKTFLLLTGNRFYYYTRPILSGGHYSAHPILKLVKQSSSPALLLTELEQRGVKYILIHAGRTLDSFVTALTPAEQARWNEFQTRHLVIKHRHGQLVLLEVVPDQLQAGAESGPFSSPKNSGGETIELQPPE